jgi:hypothetical protein
MTHTHSPVTGLATRPEDRRRYVRHVLDLDAEIAGTHVGPWPCKLRDFCRGGMHLVWETDVPKRAGHLRRDDPVQVRVRAAHLGTGQNFEVQAIVARVFEGGSAFRSPSSPSSPSRPCLESAMLTVCNPI